MKRLRLLALCVLFSVCCSCGSSDAGVIPMKELFTISTYVYDETADVYLLSPLVLNEVRDLPRAKDGIGVNYHLFLTYESGLCQVVAENRDVQLSTGFWSQGDLGEDRTYGYDLTIAREGYIVLHPFSAFGYANFRDDTQGWRKKSTFTGYTGCEFYLTVNALDPFGTAMATARLRLVQLADPSRPHEDLSGNFSIELISYEYSDAYKLMEAAS